jgi:GNAT superfamily N-acetyltransferase
MSVKLLETKDILQFLPLLREIDLGDKFLLSMLHWCDIGRRSSPLALWRVFVAYANREVIGVSGLYRHCGASANICWIGWLGVRPRFRRRGFGTDMVGELKRIAATLGSNQLWVYTGNIDFAAITFYEKNGFAKQGRASLVCPNETSDSSDEVLMITLPG